MSGVNRADIESVVASQTTPAVGARVAFAVGAVRRGLGCRAVQANERTLFILRAEAGLSAEVVDEVGLGHANASVNCGGSGGSCGGEAGGDEGQGESHYWVVWLKEPKKKQ